VSKWRFMFKEAEFGKSVKRDIEWDSWNAGIMEFKDDSVGTNNERMTFGIESASKFNSVTR